MKLQKPISIALLSILIVGCGQSINGKYTDTNNVIELDFKSGDTVVVGSALGIAREAKYKIDGDSIKIDFGTENIILKMNDKGCIDYPFIGQLCKSKQ